MKKQTSAMTLLTLVWEHGKKDTWQRINYAMRDALSLAVAGGLDFTASDFTDIYRKFRASYWVGASSEWVYSAAIVNGNRSCIEAYETWKGRLPFLAAVTIRGCNNSYLHVNSICRDRGRLAVGMAFFIEGATWEVTTFDDDKGTVRAVRRTTPKKLKAFTHDEIAALFPAPKKPAKVKVEVV